ncbi:hypothetical protein [Amycolatopsis japonica]
MIAVLGAFARHSGLRPADAADVLDPAVPPELEGVDIVIDDRLIAELALVEEGAL